MQRHPPSNGSPGFGTIPPRPDGLRRKIQSASPPWTERELVAIKAALYARALTLFDGALLMIENDRQLDFRVQSRGVIESAMYMIALDRDPAYVEK